MLALSSIVQAVDALKLASSVRARIRKVTIVGNCAMHHLLLRYPVDTLAEIPFQPHDTATVRFPEDSGTTTRRSVGRVANPSYNPFADIFPAGAEVALPPLIGGFVGSDALACLIYYAFDRAPGPMAAIDLGTNGEVMVTDGRRILVGSTAAGPAFEGVNISCGTRAVDGAIIGARVVPEDGSVALTTVGDQPPVGLTGFRAAGAGLRTPPGGSHRREGPDRLGASRLRPAPQLRRGGRAPLPHHGSGGGSPRRRCG